MHTITGILTFLFLEFFFLGNLLVFDLLGFYLLFEGSLFVLDLLSFYLLFKASLILLYYLIARPDKLSSTQYVKHYTDDYSTMDAAYKIILYTKADYIIYKGR